MAGIPPTFRQPRASPHAPLEPRAAGVLYGYLAILAVVGFLTSPPFWLLMLALLPMVAVSIVGGRVAARRRGVTHQPFPKSQAAWVNAVLMVPLMTPVVLVPNWPDPRWLCAWLLVVTAVLDVAQRVQWRRGETRETR